MKKSTQIGAAIAGAVLVVAGGSAYTAANTMTADPLMGDGSNGVTGVTVTSTDFTYSRSGDTLDKIVYNVSDDLTNNVTVTAEVTPTGTGSTVDCSITSAKVGSVITCNGRYRLRWTVADLTAIALSVQTSQTS